MARDRLVVALQLEPPTLDPTSGAAAPTDEVTYRTIFEGLTTLDATGRPVPLLATRWETADARTWTFHLRPGVRFHDGTRFDARVAAASLRRGGAAGSTNAQAEALRNIVGLDVLDPLTLRIRLGTADAGLPVTLALGDAAMVAPGRIATLATAPVGTGPFRFGRWRRGDRLRLVRNADYWGTPARLSAIDFRFIADPAAAYAAARAHAVDLFTDYPAPENLRELARDPRLTVTTGPSEAETILALNNDTGPFRDLRVRRAVAHAIDRRAILDGAMAGYGTPIGSHFPPHGPDAVPLTDRYPYDPVAARALLTAAGYPHGFDTTLKLPPPSYARRTGEIVAAQLRAVGIRTTIVPVEWAQWLDEVYGRHAFAMTIVAHVEPFDYAIYGRPDYYFGGDTRAVRALLDQLRRTGDPRARHDLLGAIQRRIADQATNAFLFQMPRLGVANADLRDLWANTPLQGVDYATVRFAGAAAPDVRDGQGRRLPWAWLGAGAIALLFAAAVRAGGWRWLARRLAILGATLVVASGVVFAALQLLPGDPAQFMLGVEASPAALATLRRELGIEGGVFARYLHWIGGTVRGDLGISYAYRVPVAGLVRDALAVSLPLAALALLLAVALGLGAALAGARRPGGAVDRVTGLAAELGLALPNFWLAMLLLLVAAPIAGLAGGGFPGWEDGVAPALAALALPALALGLPQAAVVARVARAALGEALAAEHIRTARAKGLSERRILLVHALPNAAAPILAVIGLQIPYLLAGSVLVEAVFSLPGLGRLALQAIGARDLVLVQAVVLLLVAAAIAASFVADLGQALADPRLRTQRR